MPTYDYECPKCGHEFEKFQSMNDKPLKTCPECKSRRLKRLIGTGAGIIFKGSGFYETDYRSSEYKEAQKSEKRDGADTKEKTDKKEKTSDSGTKAKKETSSEKKPKAKKTSKKKS
ncbi:MAG: zinc ribbon domain-containing protein [Candidatus Eisenbacteria bacterium]|uniref:Zinc ribbon domain-containing protein n=1 Tax=Eiseniibacteriota bacterium TaxID=2212470 RepID=A0A7Y2E747_UNCEI|nr:zinc ribbon domain-containing protein [Candidatus Eisenbacteria bacterium]